ncbi:MAG: sugar transferase [Candidatus Desulfofervidaceae bacterium]|nr:sugar transferase [Candidatus Desulfofervidaceae bacterium]
MGKSHLKSAWCFFLCLLVSDLIAFYLALGGGFFLRKSVFPHFYSNLPVFNFTFAYFASFWWMPLTFICFIALEGLYTKKVSFWESLRRLWKAILLASAVIFALITLGKMGHRISRLVLLFSSILSFFSFPFCRFLTKRLLYTLGFFQEKAIILGAGQAGQAVAKGIKRDKCYDYTIIGFLDDFKTGFVQVDGEKYPILGKLKDLATIAYKEGIKTAVLAMPSLKSAKIKELFTNVRKHVPEVLVVPELFGISLLTSELDYLFYEEIFLLHTKNNLASPLNRAIKRTFDLVLGSVIFILALPLMAIIAILIKLTSPGPVIFSQWRIGQNGKPFKIYKFRSMYQDAEERLKEILENDHQMKKLYDKIRKIPNDPRVTPIGKFLRRTSLDELPQILNVLKGDMSLVGPRAALKEEIENYYKEQAFFCFQVKPGITGLWQVSGRNKTDFEFRVRLESWYVQNWCLWLDIIILLQTIKVVLKMEGAY